MEVRAKIESSGRDARWEFDRSKLFRITNYISGICEDIHTLAQSMEDFFNIFGDDLKAVTGYVLVWVLWTFICIF